MWVLKSKYCTVQVNFGVEVTATYHNHMYAECWITVESHNCTKENWVNSWVTDPTFFLFLDPWTVTNNHQISTCIPLCINFLIHSHFVVFPTSSIRTPSLAWRTFFLAKTELSSVTSPTTTQHYEVHVNGTVKWAKANNAYTHIQWHTTWICASFYLDLIHFAAHVLSPSSFLISPPPLKKLSPHKNTQLKYH